jgi:Glycosyltransferase family 87
LCQKAFVRCTSWNARLLAPAPAGSATAITSAAATVPIAPSPTRLRRDLSASRILPCMSSPFRGLLTTPISDSLLVRASIVLRRRGEVEVACLGAAIVALLALATASASVRGSPIRANAPELSDTPSVVFLGAAACAFGLYVLALVVLRWRAGSLAAVCATAVAIQLVPLAGPLLLSRDVYAYWAYGRLAEDHGTNPYRVAPARFATDPATEAMSPIWRRSDSVYGPVFTAASEGLAEATGASAERSALSYRLLGALGMLALVAVAALAADPRRAFAAAFVGWNPLLALQFAGGGHNDVWMAVLLVGALALAARRREALSGVSWAFAAGLKWLPLALLPLELLARRRGLRVAVGAAVTAVAICAGAFALFGTAWLGALLPFAHRRAGFAIPTRLSHLGLPPWLALLPLVAALPWLVRSARRGRPRRALATSLLLCASPWVLPWYAVWVVPLAAIEDDGAAWVVALALSAYLLPDRVPF